MKVLLSVLALAFLLVGSLAGYYIYNKMAETPVSMPWQNSVSSSSAPALSKGSVVMGSTQKPASTYFVPDALEKAIKTNRDTVAWLEVPGAEVNDSVLQYSDNLYYERRDERGNYDVYGCYFMDYECPIAEREVLAPNTVIYGHSAPNDDPDGKRFSKLFRFTDINFAENHPTVFLTTREERLAWEIFAVFYTDTSFDYIQVHISGAQMKAIADRAKALSVFDYGIEISPEDKILTLSTCSDRDGKDGNYRFVVMARLLPEGVIPQEKAIVVKKTK